jgi:GT2 family glycosyltransferase
MSVKSNGVSIVLGSYNRCRFLTKTIESIRNNGITVPYEIVVIDGGSTDGSLRYLAKQKDVIAIIQHNRGTWRGKPIEQRSWGYFMNLGFKAAQGKYLCMISDDCLLVPGAIQNGCELFERLSSAGRRIGAVAFYWRDWPGPDEYWVGLGLGGKMLVNHGLYLRDALQEVGWIDEDRYRFYHADGDLCLKLWRAGYEVMDCKQAFVEHYQHANVSTRTSNASSKDADHQAYLKAWAGVFYDPATGNTGTGSLRQQFHDPHGTARRFFRLHLFNLGWCVQFCRIRLGWLRHAVLERLRRTGDDQG